MRGIIKASILVFVACAAFVCCGELLTAISGAGGSAAGGDVGVERGEAVFFGKGKCYTCHSLGGRGSAVRCPNLGIFGDKFRQPIGVRAADRKAADGYSAVKYIVESLYVPDEYVVSGFSKGLMPQVNKPPIGLDDDAIASVALFLFAASDIDPDPAVLEEIRTEQKKFSRLSSEDEPPAAIMLPPGEPEMGRLAFAKLQCFKCHNIAGVTFGTPEAVEGEEAIEKGIGPDLTSIGAIQSNEYLVESILEPNAVVVADPPGIENRGDEGSYAGADGVSKMPKFHSTITVQEMLDIAAFLKTLEGAEANADEYD